MPAVEAFAVVMPAVEAFAVVMTAFVPFTVMMTAFMAFTVMAMVIASGVGIILQCPFGQRLRGCVSGTGDTAVKLNPGLGQRILCTHADAAADQRVRLCRFQEPGKSAVAAAVGRDDLLRNDFAVLHIVELELLGVTEMLEDLSVFVGYCDSHLSWSFLNDVLCSLIVEPIVTSADQELFPVYQGLGDFPACTLVDGCHGGAGNTHLFGALLLGQPLPVKQADRLKLIQRH